MEEMEKIKDGYKTTWLVCHVIPYILEHFEPITVMDNACGSGALLLAAAERFPEYAVKMGLVQFYGVDIDANCAKMAQCNILLHGLNATHRVPYWMEAELRMDKYKMKESIRALFFEVDHAPEIPPSAPIFASPLPAGVARQSSFDFSFNQEKK